MGLKEAMMRRLEEHRRNMQRQMSGQAIAKCESESDRRLQSFKDSILKEDEPYRKAMHRMLLLKIINAYNLGEFNDIGAPP